MREKTRAQVLAENHARREGRLPGARRLDMGYVSMKIPEQDWPILMKWNPDLQSPDKETRLKAWKELEASALGDLYRVTERSPHQVRVAVRQGNKGIIIK